MSKTDEPRSADITADGRTWYRWTDKPVVPLERDAMGAYSANAARCWADTGAWMVSRHRYAFVDGYLYASDVDIDPDELQERQRRHGEQAEQWIDKGTSYYEAEIRPQVERALGRAARKKPRRDSRRGLTAYVRVCIETYGFVIGDMHWRMASGGTPHEPSWPDFYSSVTGEPAVNAGVFLQAVPNRTTRMVARLRDLARAVQSGREPDLDDFMARYGRRTGRGYGSSAGFMTDTWSMRPESVLELINAYAKLDLDDLDRMEKEARRERHAAAKRMRRRLKDDPETRARFERAYRKAIVQVEMMENHNHLMEQETNGRLREAIDRLGRFLVAEGLTDEVDDVFYLTLDELETLDPSRFASRVAEWREELARQAELDPPAFIGPAPPAQEARPEEALEEGVLRGEAASRGVVTARARVVEDTPYPPEVEPGDVLVARDAGPAWTPVFPVLGGLVLDRGAGYQHAALVAREYRIPAVIGTRRATTTIVDGQVITVDGNEGVVLLSP